MLCVVPCILLVAQSIRFLCSKVITSLLQNKLSSARQAFDAFFKRYPYCYGYWKKYADLERKNGNIDKAKEVSLGYIRN